MTREQARTISERWVELRHIDEAFADLAAAFLALDASHTALEAANEELTQKCYTAARLYADKVAEVMALEAERETPRSKLGTWLLERPLRAWSREKLSDGRMLVNLIPGLYEDIRPLNLIGIGPDEDSAIAAALKALSEQERG